MRMSGWLAVLVLVPTLDAHRIHAADFANPPAPHSAALVPFSSGSRGYGPATRWEADRAHPFVLGGLALVGTRSLLNAWLLKGGSVTAGVELPTRWGVSFVPRAHALFASGSDTGTIQWLRLAAGGRITYRSGPVLQYYELGAGMSVLDSPADEAAGGFSVGRRQLTSGSPFAQIILGLRSSAEDAPNGTLELGGVFGGGAESPGALEIAIGIAF